MAVVGTLRPDRCDLASVGLQLYFFDRAKVAVRMPMVPLLEMSRREGKQAEELLEV